MGVLTRDFTSSPTLGDFLSNRAYVTGVEGPLGSGKSVSCCAKLMGLAMQQAPDPKTNIRRTRWAVIRNTSPMLRSTTIKTWLECFPEGRCGPMRWSAPITHHIKVAPQDGAPGLDCEVLFIALDQDSDVIKLKSLDLTGAWVNEACDVPEGVVDMLTGRVGRYPPIEGAPPSWRGIIMDTNASDDQNWWVQKFELGNHVEKISVLDHEGNEVTIDVEWSLYRQPPALLEAAPLDNGCFEIVEPGFTHVEIDDGTIVPWVVEDRFVLPGAGRHWYPNPFAENRRWLEAGYYAQQVRNKTLPWLQRFMQCKRVLYTDGKPWIPEYADGEMSKRRLIAAADMPLLGGIDIGGGTLNPAAVIGQRGVAGDWRVLKELSVFDTGFNVFTDRLKAFLAEEFPGRKVRFYLDPAAKQRDPIFKIAIEEHLRNKLPEHDFLLCETNDQALRREAIAVPMGRLVSLGHTVAPGVMIDPGCTYLRAGLAGKWARRKIQSTGTLGSRYATEPEKNEFSHVCDAFGYMLMGGGEGRVLQQASTSPGKIQPLGSRQGGARLDQTVVLNHDWNPHRT